MMRREWTREELIVAFNLYCKIPFGRIHRGNPEIIALAKSIGRTPSAVSWKLANFARLDPALKQRKIRGATHGARSEVEIWDEFNGDWERLAFESERLLKKLMHAPESEDIDSFPEGRTRETIVRTRVNQSFFRAAVLTAYGNRCCVSGLSVPSLLNASHIVPWSVDVKNRTNPRNGLCLNVILDRAFDCGLITVTPDLKVRVSNQIKAEKDDDAVREFVGRFDLVSIRTPSRFAPNETFLAFHNQHVFLS